MTSKIIIGLSCLVLLACNTRGLKFVRYNAQSGPNGSLITQQMPYIDVFIVSNFSDSQSDELEIDDFGCKRIDSMRDSIANHTIEFYKKSRKTNISYLSKHPSYFNEGNIFSNGNSQSEDYLWTYYFDTDRNRYLKAHNGSSRFRPLSHPFYFPDPACINHQ